MTVLKAERTMNLYKVIRSVVLGDASVATEKDTTRLWHMRLGHMSERDVQALHNKKFYQVLNTANLTYINFALWVDSQE